MVVDTQEQQTSGARLTNKAARGDAAAVAAMRRHID